MTRCSLCPHYRPPVPFEGPTPCRVAFLFEAPHHKEDEYGRPVIGPTGQEFEGLYLPLINLPRSEVYIANARCCSERDYKNPTPEQALSCASVHLGPMLERVKPQVLVLAGAVSCSLFGINPTTEHGIPRMGKWGSWSGILYPTFHITAGMRQAAYMIPLLSDFDGLRKLLLDLGKGTFQWPSDPYPEPDYRVCRTVRDVADYLENGPRVIACDTESLPTKEPYCVTFSHTPGTGRLIYVDDRDSMRRLKNVIQVHNPQLAFHNYLHDVTVFEKLHLPICQFTDTMIHAYNLCLGGGGDDDEAGRGARGSLSLKMLAYRYLNMTMTSFRDTVYPHSIPLMLDWLKQVRSTFEPISMEPTCQCGHLTTAHEARGKTLRHTGPCSLCSCKRHRQFKRPPLSEEEKRFNLLHRKTNNLITATENRQVAEELDMDEDDYPFVDPWKRVRDWHEWDRQFANDYVGPWPRASIEHVPELELLKYACLAGESLVQTETGPRKIKELVDSKYSGCVLGVHPKTNTIVKRRVTGWHRVNSKERIDWLAVKTEHSICGRWGLMATRYTPDHKLMTSRGMVAVSELKRGDNLYLPYERLTKNQLQVTLGSLLGDGCLHHKNKDTGWCYLSVSHSHKQKPYLDWKSGLMGGLVSSECNTPAGTKNAIGGRPVESSEHFSFNTSMHPEFLDYRKRSYGPGRRIGDWIEDIDELGLAICYQDNGTITGRTARIYLQRFDADSVDRFRTTLLDKFNVKTTRYWCHRGGWAIHVRVESRFVFFHLIQRYVHPCTQYKLPEEFRDKFEPVVGDIGRGIFTSKVVDVVESPQSKGRRGGLKTSYCIDVEEIHNFLTPYEVAKNCRDADATLRLHLFLEKLHPWLWF